MSAMSLYTCLQIGMFLIPSSLYFILYNIYTCLYRQLNVWMDDWMTNISINAHRIISTDGRTNKCTRICVTLYIILTTHDWEKEAHILRNLTLKYLQWHDDVIFRSQKLYYFVELFLKWHLLQYVFCVIGFFCIFNYFQKCFLFACTRVSRVLLNSCESITCISLPCIQSYVFVIYT